MALQIGDQAPKFEGIDQEGNPIKLSDYEGKKVILYFYPKDNTPGCTAQACNLRDNYEELLNQGFEIIGISVDGTDSHQKFREKYDLPFPLIADTDKSIHEMYGTWGEKNMYGRKYMGAFRQTFIIDKDGKIEHIIKKVKTKDHADQILSKVSG